ncbi:hypothetical protein PSG77_03825 [Enterococcus hirae]|uniref:hypothetical protein n=1 Tax=Enterococcus hirae TaxID=1354 RepID=UPI002953637F|nr:hypothetical protein [Enterococcus hirae]MDV7771329.1 hypothetical protein [Enterococcus hirae]
MTQWLRKKFSNNQDKEVNEMLLKLNKKIHEPKERYSPAEAIIRLYALEKKAEEVNSGDTSYESHTEAFHKEIQVHSQEKIYLTDYLNIWLQINEAKLQEYKLDTRFDEGNLKEFKEELAKDIKIKSEILSRCLGGKITNYRLNQQAYQEMFGRINPKGCQRNKVVIDFQVTKKITDFSLNKGRDQMESHTNQKTQTNGCQTMESITDKIKDPGLIETKAQSSETKIQDNPVR